MRDMATCDRRTAPPTDALLPTGARRRRVRRTKAFIIPRARIARALRRPSSHAPATRSRDPNCPTAAVRDGSVGFRPWLFRTRTLRGRALARSTLLSRSQTSSPSSRNSVATLPLRSRTSSQQRSRRGESPRASPEVWAGGGRRRGDFHHARPGDITEACRALAEHRMRRRAAERGNACSSQGSGVRRRVDRAAGADRRPQPSKRP